MENNFLTYKGRPLVRCNDTIYYGDMHEKYVAFLHIQTTKMQGEVAVPDRIIVQLLSTDETLNPVQRIANKGERNGLFNAIELADIWLSRYCAKENEEK